jgi:hypothetical protein
MQTINTLASTANSPSILFFINNNESDHSQFPSSFGVKKRVCLLVLYPQLCPTLPEPPASQHEVMVEEMGPVVNIQS